MLYKLHAHFLQADRFVAFESKFEGLGFLGDFAYTNVLWLYKNGDALESSLVKQWNRITAETASRPIRYVVPNAAKHVAHRV